MKEFKWIKEGDWHYLDQGDGEIIASISAFSFPFCCFLKGAKAGEYTTLEMAKEKLLEKCQKLLR